MPGAFPDLPRHEDNRTTYDDASISFAEDHPPPVTAAYTINHQGPLVNPPHTEGDLESKPILPDLPAYRNNHPLSPQKLESSSITSSEGCVSNPAPADSLLKCAGCSGNHSQIFWDLLFWPISRLQRYRSDENLDMQRQAESLLADTELCVDSGSLDTSPQRPPKGGGSESDRETQTAQPKNTKQGLDPETPPKPPSHTPPVVTEPPHANPELSSSTSTREKPAPPSLSSTKIGLHNTQVPPLQKPRAKLQRASEYMKMIVDEMESNETASSLATSVVSTRTRRSLQFSGFMLPMQDKKSSCNYLGKHTERGNADAVRMLLKKGCNPGTIRHPRQAPIFNVIKGASARHTQCLRLLLDHGVDVNVHSEFTYKTPLLKAIEQDVWSGYSTVIFLLLKAGADPNAKDRSGDVPLLKLLRGGTHPLDEGRRRALALLLTPTFGTNVSVTIRGTRNKALHLAIRRKDPWAVDMLLNKSYSRRDIEAENSEGLTPLLLTASLWRPQTMTTNQLAILDYLLEKCANVNVKMPRTGQTPLHIAIGYGLVDVVKELMRHGANPSLKTREGETAWDAAREKRRLDRCGGCRDCVKIRRMLGERPRGY